MRVAQVITASVGGIGRHVASVVTRLVQRGHAVRIYAPAQTVRAHILDDVGADTLPLGRLGRLAGADVVHAHGYKAGALAVPVCRLRRIPLVVTWHNAVLGSGRRAKAGRFLQILVARSADLTLGASSDLVAEARRLGARDARLAPVAAPVLGFPTVPRDVQRRQLGIGDAETMILTASRLAPQKNLGMVLDIARAVRDHHELIFVIAGDGPQREELAQRVRAEKSSVRLIGHRADIASLLGAADLALLTSTWEARALVAQEALLAGVPLISTRVGGIEELVGNAAVLLDPDDVEHAVAELLELSQSPGRRAALQASGLARAASWPDEDQVVDRLVALYREVSAHRQPERPSTTAGSAGHSSLDRGWR
jgi:glycosyltransferase involved in cell wall biosynthesis